MTAEAAGNLVGNSRSHRQTQRYRLVYRSVEHNALRKLCGDICKPTLPHRYANHAPDGGFGPDLEYFATTLLQLQDQRHLADYDPLFPVTRGGAIGTVQKAREALVRFRHAKPARRRELVTLAIFTPREHRQPEI